jgi:hypothetical protein
LSGPPHLGNERPSRSATYPTIAAGSLVSALRKVGLLMPIAVCSVCGKRPQGRLASLYWAKWSGDGTRAAWKQRYCKKDYEAACTDWLDAARAASDADGGRSCLLCDEASPHELVETYCTAFVPEVEAERFTVAACLHHYNELAAKTTLGGVTLDDRSQTGMSASRATGW